MAVVLFVVVALILAFSLSLFAAYKLAKWTPYRTAIRAWIVTLLLELVTWPMLYALLDLAFNFSAHTLFFILLLLLVPILPALVGLQYDKLRKQKPELFR